MAELPSEKTLFSNRPPLRMERRGVTAARLAAPPAATGAAEGEAVLGRGLSAFSGDIAETAIREKEHYDATRAEDAFNQLRERQLDLTYGKDNGFANLKGGEAVNRPLLKDWGQKFDDAARQIEDALPDDQAKERFRLRAGIARASFDADIMRHQETENRQYMHSTFQGTVDVETRAAMSNWDNQSAIDLSTERIGNAVKLYADSQGWQKDDPQRLALGMHAVSGLHAAVITQALQNSNPAYAEAYYEKTKGSIDPSVVKTLGNQVEAGVQKQLATEYQSAFLASHDDISGLGDLAKKVTADEKLDEDRKNILLGRIESRQDLLANRAIVQEDRRVRMLRGQIDQVNKITLAGYEPTAEQLLPLVQAAKGTELEPEVRQMIATANLTRQFRLSTPQQQEATITALETEARKDPTKFDVTVVDRFKKIQANQQQEVKSDPVTFALRQGLVKQNDPSVQAIDVTKLAESADQLQSRFSLARAVSERYGSPVKPLTHEESDALSAQLKNATAPQKSALFSQLVVGSRGDFDGYKAVMAQIAPDDPVTAHAGIMAGRARLTTDAGFKPDPGQANQVSDLILRGQSVLHPNRREDGQPDKGKIWPMPKDDDLAKLFASTERDAFAGRPEARNGFYQTAKAIYAARAVEAGDTSGVLDSSRWDEAIKLSTGGIERWNGKSILMPWGMDRGRFKDELRMRINDMEAADRLPKNITTGKLYDSPLESIGDGRYVFRAGDGVLVDKAGKAMIVDFNQPALSKPIGIGLPSLLGN